MTTDSNGNEVSGGLPCSVACPSKAFTIEISCDGHSFKEAVAHLRRFVGTVCEGGEGTNMTCGNGWVRVVQNPGQTEDKYHVALSAVAKGKRR